MTVEQALEQVIRDTQGALNGLQQNLRALCSAEDQQVDDDEDFMECVRLENETEDLVDTITHLLAELPAIAAEIRGPCPSGSRGWYAAHKLERKNQAAADKARRQEAARQAKEEARAAKAAAKGSK
jgi:hypothetical protein